MSRAAHRRTAKHLAAAEEAMTSLRLEVLDLTARNQQLQHETIRLAHHARLAYLEGVDQGRALAYREVC